jgi:hypothetical protein
MTLAQETVNVPGNLSGLGAVHLLLTGSDVELMAERPEQVMEDIEARATVVSSILAGILLEPHGRPDWGLND